MSDKWRLVLSNGVVVDVKMLCNPKHPYPWAADCAWIYGLFRQETQATAVSSLADGVTKECVEAGIEAWVSGTLAPGELTPDERVTAERERCAAIAEGVASERDRREDMAVMDGDTPRHRDVAATAWEIAAKIRKG